MRICFAFLVLDELLNPDIWDNYFNELKIQNIDYRIIVHAKKNNAFNLNSDFIYSNTVETSWKKLVEAEIKLIEASIKHNCDYIILLSPQCLPIKSSVEFYHHCLNLNGRSQIFNTDPWFLKSLNKEFIQNYKMICGGWQWMLISKFHQNVIYENKREIISMSQHCDHVDCEVVIQSFLKKNDLLDEKLNLNFEITFADWRFPERGGNSPRTLLSNNINYDIKQLLKARDSKYLFFARKFNYLKNTQLWNNNGNLTLENKSLYFEIIYNFQYFFLLFKHPLKFYNLRRNLQSNNLFIHLKRYLSKNSNL